MNEIICSSHYVYFYYMYISISVYPYRQKWPFVLSEPCDVKEYKNVQR